MSLGVTNRGNETAEQLWRRFKKSLKKEDRMAEILKNRFYVKPSEKRKMKERRKKLSDGTDLSGNVKG